MVTVRTVARLTALALPLAALVQLAGCTTQAVDHTVTSGASVSNSSASQEALRPEATVSVFDPARALEEYWQTVPLNGLTSYTLVAMDGRVAIRGSASSTASGLAIEAQIDLVKCPDISWVWRVDQVQRSANIRERDREDVAASVFLLFGDYGFFANLRPVPTLRYVWTNDSVERYEIVDNPYLPGVVKSIVLQAGVDNLGQWIRESRNVVEDYKQAFGAEPQESVTAVILLTDSDQTGETATAYYGQAQAQCM